MATPKGEATRRQIVEAAWAAAEDAGIEQLLGGVSLREVARRAEVSASVVTYHFGTMADLAEAMVQSCMDELSMLPVEAVAEFLDQGGASVAESIRAAADTNWDILAEPVEQRYERRLMRLFAATGSPIDGERIRRAFAEGYWEPVIAHLEQIYVASAERLGMRFIEPFTAASVARVGAAMNESLIQQWIIQRDDSFKRLHSDAIVALLIAVSVPAGRSGELPELELRFSGWVDSYTRTAGADPDDQVIDLMRDLAVSAAGLFANDNDGVTLTDVANAVALPVRDVAARFASVRHVAAVSFFRHVERIQEASVRRVDRDPLLGLVDLLCELARAAQSDRHSAHALLAERTRAQMTALKVTETTDVRILVPLGPVLFARLRPLVDRSNDVVYDLSAIMLDTVLAYAATRPDLAPAAVAEVVVRLIPPN